MSDVCKTLDVEVKMDEKNVISLHLEGRMIDTLLSVLTTALMSARIPDDRTMDMGPPGRPTLGAKGE